MVINGIIFLKH